MVSYMLVRVDKMHVPDYVFSDSPVLLSVTV